MSRCLRPRFRIKMTKNKIELLNNGLFVEIDYIIIIINNNSNNTVIIFIFVIR